MGAKACAPSRRPFILVLPDISASCISKWKKRRQETGSLAPGKTVGHKKRVLDGENALWLRRRLDTENRSVTSSRLTPAWRAAAKVASSSNCSAFQNDMAPAPASLFGLVGS